MLTQTHVGGTLVKHTHDKRQDLQWPSVKEWTPGSRINTNRSPKVSNVIAVKTLLLYDSDGSSGSCSHQREPSKAVCYDNNNCAMVSRRKCVQRRKRVGRHAV